MMIGTVVKMTAENNVSAMYMIGIKYIMRQTTPVNSPTTTDKKRLNNKSRVIRKKIVSNINTICGKENWIL